MKDLKPRLLVLLHTFSGVRGRDDHEIDVALTQAIQGRLPVRRDAHRHQLFYQRVALLFNQRIKVALLRDDKKRIHGNLRTLESQTEDQQNKKRS